MKIRTDIDPNVVAALKAVGPLAELPRLKAAAARNARLEDERFRTQMELLADEVSRAIPPSSPLFETVLLLVCLKKIQKAQAMSEGTQRTDFDQPFPPGW